MLCVTVAFECVALGTLSVATASGTFLVIISLRGFPLPLYFQAHSSEFEPSGAVKELYVYAAKYREQVLMGLEGDLHCRKLHLSHKLLNVACTLEGEQTSMC